jgi:hypothetical protein
MTTTAQGAHYKGDGEEHHKRVMRLKLNWYQANITKYAERAYRKGQTLDDIEKIIVYATMWKDHLKEEQRAGSKVTWVDGEPDRNYVDQS